MMRYRVKVQGMTCTGCEKHVSVALENIGATNIGVNFQKGEAIFKLPDGVEPETAKKAIANTKYEPGYLEKIQIQEKVRLGDEGDDDYISIGSETGVCASS